MKANRFVTIEWGSDDEMSAQLNNVGMIPGWRVVSMVTTPDGLLVLLSQA